MKKPEISKPQKLRIDAIQVESFITNETESFTILGGINDPATRNTPPCIDIPEPTEVGQFFC